MPRMLAVSWSLAVALLTACPASNVGLACGDRRCATGEACCIDCDGRGTCGAPGLVCGGGACGFDGGTTDAGSGLACGDTRCARGQVCCIDCNGRGTCGAPGATCTGSACNGTACGNLLCGFDE